MARVAALGVLAVVGCADRGDGGGPVDAGETCVGEAVTASDGVAAGTMRWEIGEDWSERQHWSADGSYDDDLQRFDRHGNLISDRQTVSWDDTTDTLLTTWDYDADGHELLEVRDGSDGLTTVDSYWDGDELVESDTDEGADGVVDLTERYTYDGLGRWVSYRKERTDAPPTVSTRTFPAPERSHFEQDDGDDGAVDVVVDSLYDDHDRLLSSVTLIAEFGTITSLEETWEGDGDLASRRYTVTSGEWTLDVYTWDERHHPLTQVETESTSGSVGRTDWTWTCSP